MKIASLLVQNTNKQFWFLCESCENTNRRYAMPYDYTFVEVRLDQFPEYFGQTCFTCPNILKEGPELFNRSEVQRLGRTQ